MEGGEEGMVAVVRGLRNAGLAVTLLNGELASPIGSIYAPKINVLTPYRFSQGTTARLPITSTVGAQVCDDRYTSSYQFAHCNHRPTSPPVLLPEFPRRKSETRNRSHFEVSSDRFDSAEQTHSSCRPASSVYRSSFGLYDRTIPAYDARASEAFAFSLRKYPPQTLERTPSAELICKLLSYTHNKNNATTKHPRSPKDKPERDKNYKDKDIQTYTRTKPKAKDSEESTKSPKRMRIHSPEVREKRHKDPPFTYDYLRPPSPRFSRATEVRYLSDVSKCIRDTIRQIVDDNRPEVCSPMTIRYLQHRKRCQSRPAKQVGETSKDNSTDCVATGIMTTLPYIPDECMDTCPAKAPPCCYCGKSAKEAKEEFGRKVAEKIGTWLSEIPTYAKMTSEEQKRRIKMAENLANKIVALKDDEDIENKSRREVEECVNKLPMWVPSAKDDRIEFKALAVDNLMTKLKRVFEGTDMFDNEISKWINGIRFKSRDSLGDIVDKDKIADTVADRVKSLALTRPENDDAYQSALKNEVKDVLHSSPILTNGDKNREIDRLADNLVDVIKDIPASEINPKRVQIDKFSNEITKWLSGLELKRKDSEGNEVKKEEIIDEIVERLKTIAFDRPDNIEEYHEALKNETAEILEEIPLQVEGSTSKFFDKLSNKLADNLKDIPAEEIKPITDKLDDQISQWIEDIQLKRKDSDGESVDKRDIAKKFAERLKPLVIDRPENNEDHFDTLKNEMVDILADMPVEVSGDKTKTIEKLADKLTHTIKDIAPSQIKLHKDTDKFERKINKWMKDVKFKKKDSHGESVHKSKIADSFVERLKFLAVESESERPEDKEEYIEALKKEAVEMLEESPIDVEGENDKAIDKMATKLVKTLQDIPSSQIRPKKDKFEEKISQWIKEVKLKKKDDDGEKIDKEEVVEKFAERLKYLALERPEDDEEYLDALKEEILNILEDTPIEAEGKKEKKVNKLATKLAKTLKDIPLDEIKQRKEMDKFDHKISQWIKDIKLDKKDSKGELVNKDKIADRIADNIKALAVERPDDDNQYREALINETIDILEDLPIAADGNKDKIVEKHASKLAKVLKDIPATVIKEKKKTNKFDDKISKWVKTVKWPKKGDKVDVEKVAEKFSEKLRPLAVERPENDKEYHEVLKKKAVSILEDLPIETTGRKSKEIDKMAEKITKTLKTVPASEVKPKSEFEEKITQWIENVKLKRKDSQGGSVIKDKVIDKVAERLIPLAMERPENDAEFHEVLKKETEDLLRKLPVNIKDDKKVQRLANKLAKTLKTIPASDVKATSARRKSSIVNEEITNWLQDLQELSGTPEEKKEMADDLAKMVLEYKAKHGDDPEGLEIEIKKWLADKYEKKGIRMDNRTLDKLASQLAGNIQKSEQAEERKAASKLRARSGSDYKQDCAIEIKGWLDDIPQLSASPEEKKKMIDDLAKKLGNLHADGMVDEDLIRDEIADWLNTESEKRGIRLDSRAKDNLVNQLTGKIVKVKPTRKASYEVQAEMSKAIWNKLKEFPEVKETEQNKALVENFAKKMTNINNELGEGVSNTNIRKEVNNWIQDFADRTGLDDKHKDSIAKDVTSKLKDIMKPNAKQNEIKQAITNDIAGINDSNAPQLSAKEKKNVGRRVAAFLSRQIKNGVPSDDPETRKNIMKIINEETDLSDAEARELADLFIGSSRRISAMEQRASIKSQSPEDVRKFLSQQIKNATGNLNISNLGEIEDQLTDILADQVLSGVDPETTRERIMELLMSADVSEDEAREITMRLTSQALDYSSNLGETYDIPHEFTLMEKETFQTNAIKEITDFMDEVIGEKDPKLKRNMRIAAQNVAERLGDAISDPNQTSDDKEMTIRSEADNYLKRFSVSVEEHGPELAKRLRKIAATSTPRHSLDGCSFYPRRSMVSSSIDFSDKVRQKMEINYTSSLEKTIKDWIQKLPIKIDDKAMNNIVKDLASDIADRQKYLQSHPEVKPTPEEELEFFKYQIFRAVGKSVEPEDLAVVMNQASNLLSKIKTVEVPIMSKPKKRFRSHSQVLNKLVDEVSNWVDDISGNIEEERLENERRQAKVKELADKIQVITEKKEKMAEKVDNEITKWLRPMVKDIKQSNVQSMSDLLKKRLTVKGLLDELSTSARWFSDQSIGTEPFQLNSSEFLEENLFSGILDWLKGLPLHQRRTSSEKQKQKDLVQEMAKQIKNMIDSSRSGTDLDMEILKEAKKHFEQFPMETDLKSDSEYIEKMSAQVVDLLNNMQLYQDMSARRTGNPIEHLISTVNDWIKSLPMPSRSFNTKDIEDDKMDFIGQLNQAMKEPAQQNDQLVKDDIKQFLGKLPVHVDKANDPKYVSDKVEQLYKNILGTYIGAQGRPTINRDLVEAAVQDWSKKLPYSPGKTHLNVSDQLQDFTSDISSILKDIKASAVDNYTQSLQEKTMDFVKQLPMQSNKISSPAKLQEIADDLIKSIKEKAAELTPKQTSKNAADVLYDNIMTWCDDLPLAEGNTPEEKERNNSIRNNLASKLIKKIGELNMNPEILNDDVLYENLMQEEINDLMSDLPLSPEMEENLESIKENLMSKIRLIKQATQDEIAGNNYKQQLRDTISKSLPLDTCLCLEEPEAFELLVNNLADAYVDLHFISDDDEQKMAYKKKIADVITNYCNGYLQRHPESPLNSVKLNQDLYDAIKSLPTPKNDIMRAEAEHVRMKNEINDWMTKHVMDGSLSETTGAEQVQNNKMATVLAKKLLELEKEKEVNPYINFGKKAQKEISKMTRTLPIAAGHEAEIDDMVQDLIQQLQSTEQSRRISLSTSTHSIDLGDSIEESLALCTCRRQKQKNIPKCSLTADELAYLEVIRSRNRHVCTTPPIFSCKDASVNPLPIDAGSQTEISTNIPCPIVCPRIPVSVSPRISPCAPSSEQEVAPQIIIKEYLWDSGTSKLLGPVYRLPCMDVETSNSSVRSFQRPLQKSVCVQPSPCSIPQRPCTQEVTPPRPCTQEAPSPRPCVNLGRSPCPSSSEMATPKPSSYPKTPCPPPSKLCSYHRSTSPSQMFTPEPCPSPKPPCVQPRTCKDRYTGAPISTPKPCSSLGTSPYPSLVMPPLRPCNVPKHVVSSATSPCTHRSVHTSHEIPYFSTPRRPVVRDQNVPFRQPCFQPSYSGTSSPIDNVSRRYVRPRTINIGGFEEPPRSPCQRRRVEEDRISENDYSLRRRIYRVPSRDCSRETHRDSTMRCCKCKHRIRNVCQRHGNPHCPSSENVRHCAKCCGMPCPHPMDLFFR